MVIQAEEIKHDRDKKQMNYKNAFLKVYDIPVLYFPNSFILTQLLKDNLAY